MPNFNDLTIYLKVNYVFLNIQFAIAVVGMIGNILVILVFARKSLRKYSYSFYCQMKACGDMIVLLYAYRNWANFVLDSNLDLTAPFFCVLNQVLPYVAGAFALEILVIMSLDRLLTVAYPNRFKLIKKKWLQVLVVILVAAYSWGINIVLPFNTQYTVTQVGTQTIISCTISAAISIIQSWIRNGNILFIILIVNNSLNIKLIWFIISSRKRVANNSQTRSTSKDRKMAISGIGLSLTALICKLPLGVVTVISNYQKLPYDQAIMITYISITLLVVENAASFFLNMFLNSMFRDELFKMLGLLRLTQFSLTSSRGSKTNNFSTTNN